MNGTSARAPPRSPVDPWGQGSRPALFPRWGMNQSCQGNPRPRATGPQPSGQVKVRVALHRNLARVIWVAFHMAKQLWHRPFSAGAAALGKPAAASCRTGSDGGACLASRRAGDPLSLMRARPSHPPGRVPRRTQKKVRRLFAAGPESLLLSPQAVTRLGSSGLRSRTSSQAASPFRAECAPGHSCHPAHSLQRLGDPFHPRSACLAECAS
jgi:hypothetical protein